MAENRNCGRYLQRYENGVTTIEGSRGYIQNNCKNAQLDGTIEKWTGHGPSIRPIKKCLPILEEIRVLFRYRPLSRATSILMASSVTSELAGTDDILEAD